MPKLMKKLSVTDGRTNPNFRKALLLKYLEMSLKVYFFRYLYIA